MGLLIAKQYIETIEDLRTVPIFFNDQTHLLPIGGTFYLPSDDFVEVRHIIGGQGDIEITYGNEDKIIYVLKEGLMKFTIIHSLKESVGRLTVKHPWFNALVGISITFYTEEEYKQYVDEI